MDINKLLRCVAHCRTSAGTSTAAESAEKCGSVAITRSRSSCRAREAAFGCAAVVRSDNAVCQVHRALRVYDCCAAERSLAGSAAATKSVLRQLLQDQPVMSHSMFIRERQEARYGGKQCTTRCC
ncbi:CstA-like transporter-associated (seleno)protein [Pseudomonas sp. C9]|uniref:CstA-like transporter-associated (seleno)protein n=1 Tax=Pseudomonas sp. C9 TaxID=1311337 RepID=UPI003531B61B